MPSSAAKRARAKYLLKSELERLGIVPGHSTPYHPQTCGKVERFHQTQKKFLDKQPPASSLAVLQAQLDAFRAYYNQHRPHRALNGDTPLHAYHARIKAGPSAAPPPVHYRVRHDRVDKSGRVTVSYLSRRYHVGTGCAHQAPAHHTRDRQQGHPTPARGRIPSPPAHARSTIGTISPKKLANFIATMS